jgi:exopolysaccharide production protein ExoZ
MIYSVQYMRAIAALMVVIHHSAWKGVQYSSDPLSWFNVGGAGVDLFFIISGYIMCITVDQKQIKISSFIKARILRIIPVYWVLTTLALIVFLVFPEKVNSSGGDINIIASYMLFPTEDKYLNQNGWTLSYEFLFYALFSFCLAVKTSYKYLIPVGMITALVFLGGLLNINNYQVNFITNPLLLEFCFGILAFYLSRRVKFESKYGLILIGISVLSIIFVNISHLDYSRVIRYGVPALLFFLGMLIMEPIFKNNHSNILFKSLKAMGDSSYSLYLFHPFSLVICSIVLSRIGINEFGVLFVALLVVTSVISGHLCYLLLEKPLAKLMRTNKKIQTTQTAST